MRLLSLNPLRERKPLMSVPRWFLICMDWFFLFIGWFVFSSQFWCILCYKSSIGSSLQLELSYCIHHSICDFICIGHCLNQISLMLKEIASFRYRHLQLILVSGILRFLVLGYCCLTMQMQFLLHFICLRYGFWNEQSIPRKVSEISVSALGLRSFRFSGALLKTYNIHSAAMLEDVYISSGMAVPAVSLRGWVKPLGELVSLKVLTLCSVTLECIAAFGARAEVGYWLFPTLVELQLLMTMMADSNLSDIYGFFKYYPCPRLEKLFLELPMSACDPSMAMYLEMPREEPPKVGFSNLKVVKMNEFKGHLNEMELARCFVNEVR